MRQYGGSSTTPQLGRPPLRGRYQRLDGDTAQRLWVQAHEHAGRQRNTAGARIRRISLLGGLVLPVRCRGSPPLLGVHFAHLFDHGAAWASGPPHGMRSVAAGSNAEVVLDVRSAVCRCGTRCRRPCSSRSAQWTASCRCCGCRRQVRHCLWMGAEGLAGFPLQHGASEVQSAAGGNPACDARRVEASALVLVCRCWMAASQASTPDDWWACPSQRAPWLRC
jgi:hypothetical protein